jgi:hypothetical protein
MHGGTLNSARDKCLSRPLGVCHQINPSFPIRQNRRRARENSSGGFCKNGASLWCRIQAGKEEFAMLKRQPRTEDQLSDVIMTEVRKHPECCNIERVAIFRPLQPTPRHPNWSFAWIRTGAATAPLAGIIARRLQEKFDLA